MDEESIVQQLVGIYNPADATNLSLAQKRAIAREYTDYPLTEEGVDFLLANPLLGERPVEVLLARHPSNWPELERRLGQAKFLEVLRAAGNIPAIERYIYLVGLSGEGIVPLPPPEQRRRLAERLKIYKAAYLQAITDRDEDTMLAIDQQYLIGSTILSYDTDEQLNYTLQLTFDDLKFLRSYESKYGWILLSQLPVIYQLEGKVDKFLQYLSLLTPEERTNAVAGIVDRLNDALSFAEIRRYPAIAAYLATYPNDDIAQALLTDSEYSLT